MTYDPRQIEKVQQLLTEIGGPRGMKSVVIPAMVDYIIGDDNHGLKHAPAYKMVSRTAAYGQPFFSDKQRRFVMAGIRDGSIRPGQDNRTGRLQGGWVATGEPYRQKITNRVPYAPHVMGDGQARQPAMVGWRRISDVVQSNMSGALRAGIAALNAWLRTK
jgi:hypothetical protein